MKKFASFVAGAMLLGGSFAVQADDGPFFLHLNEFCDIYEVYLKDGKMLYGMNVGCGGLPDHSSMGGGYTGNNSGAFGYEYANDPRMSMFDSDGSFSIYLNSGTGLTLFNTATWYLGSGPLSVESDKPSMNEAK